MTATTRDTPRDPAAPQGGAGGAEEADPPGSQPCPECEGKGYAIASYTWEWGNEFEPRECPECEGNGWVMPVVETEEFTEEYR